MVFFINANSTHFNSVKNRKAVPINSIQMDVKVPVQPPNLNGLCNGAFLGAHIKNK